MNDEMLVLYYYNDGLSNDERQEVCNALAADPEIAERYRRLASELAAISDGPPPPLPEDRLQRFRGTIDREARMERGKRAAAAPAAHAPSFAWGAGITAALALGIALGVWLAGTDGRGDGDTVLTHAATAAVSGNAAFTRGVRAHFRDSRDELVNLSHSGDSERVALIAGLIEQNRLYERAATHHDAPDLARVLRAFEPILVRLAAEDIAPADAEELRAQLAFELNVMLTKLGRDSSDESHST